MLLYGAKYIPTIGTSYESFLTTVAGCLMTTTVISTSYLLSKNTEVLVRSTLFVRILNNNLTYHNSILQNVQFFFLGNYIWMFCINLLFQFIIITYYSGLHDFVSDFYNCTIYYIIVFSNNIGICKKINF